MDSIRFAPAVNPLFPFQSRIRLLLWSSAVDRGGLLSHPLRATASARAETTEPSSEPRGTEYGNVPRMADILWVAVSEQMTPGNRLTVRASCPCPQ